MSIWVILLAFAVSTIIMWFKLNNDGYHLAAQMIISAEAVYGWRGTNKIVTILTEELKLDKKLLKKYVMKHLRTKNINEQYIKVGIENYEAFVSRYTD